MAISRNRFGSTNSEQETTDQTRETLAVKRGGGRGRGGCGVFSSHNGEGVVANSHHSHDSNTHHRQDECKYKEWSGWSRCSATCGHGAVRQRNRDVDTTRTRDHPANCISRLETKVCNLQPCPLN
ncbi:hypothetical protein AAG570_005628 [Ranatra chinensis]|uniref:Spondin-like TSP1 domain-containing protein n=1 Tax=Ranatra chinensis TaxID=642074 RepID=A0ABD0YAT5_9HEMI